MSSDDTLNKCGCCPDEPEPPVIYNPPGQPKLNYRIGTHGSFKQRMIANLTRQRLVDGDHAGQKPLLDLTTREDDDPSIALLDAWAVAADILAFYTETIANEGYLRTATERRSILELARAIGYELGPGVAAETYLQFTVEEAPGAPQEAVIGAGVGVQSIPSKQGELPQTFETAEEFTGRAKWNKLTPQLTEVQQIGDIHTVAQVYLRGTANNLQVGDMLLLIQSNATAVMAARHIEALETDFDLDHTVVTLETLPESAAGSVAAGSADVAAAGVGGGGGASGLGGAFSGIGVENSIISSELSEASIQVTLGTYGWLNSEIEDYLDAQVVTPSGLSVHVFREKAACFGHNAPRWQTLPDPAETRGKTAKDPYATPWDPNSPSIWTDSQGNSYSLLGDANAYLERSIKGIIEESWVVFTSPSNAERAVYQVQKAFDASLVDYALSGKATGLVLIGADGGSPNEPTHYKVRTTTAFVQSEELDLASLPVTGDVPQGSTQLKLETMVLGLAVGQPIALHGEQADASGVLRDEVRILKGITHGGGRTTLEFESGLEYTYKRDTMTLSANVVRATHGETVPREILGSGQGGQKNQRFRLKKPPITHVSASTPSGVESTLETRVNGVKWEESSSLYSLTATDKKYIVRRGDDGSSTIIFGDGVHGARLPTGQENVEVTYRSGVGTAGEVDARSLTLLKAKPLGVREVTNPVPASGAGEPETMDTARENAPLTVKTLDRIVSLQDFTDFTRAFAGIGKAQAVPLWSGEQQIVHITIAAEDGDAIAEDSSLYTNLRDAINGARDPLQTVKLGDYQPRYFGLKANIRIDPAYRWEDVEAAARDALAKAFTFDARQFGQPVTAAEIINLVHDLAGVVAVDLDKLHLLNASGGLIPPELSTVLTAQLARFDAAGQEILPAELLLINVPGIELLEDTT